MREPGSGSAPGEAEPFRQAVLGLARRAVETWVGAGLRIEAPVDASTWREPRGVFVTLHAAGELRGCIGYPEPVLALGQAVVQAAIAAAVDDPRFPPVSRAELPLLDYEVTLLGPLREALPREVEPGRHGLVVSDGSRRGLLLPQVARERGWSAERFLSETCRKAGLPVDAWRRGARVEVFEAEVLNEETGGRSGSGGR